MYNNKKRKKKNMKSCLSGVLGLWVLLDKTHKNTLSLKHRKKGGEKW